MTYVYESEVGKCLPLNPFSDVCRVFGECLQGKIKKQESEKKEKEISFSQ